MAYFEGEIPTMSYGCGYNNNNSGFGGEWGGLIGLIIAASIFNGNGIIGGNNGRGQAATQADLAAGFNNSAVLSNLNDILLQNSQGFAAVQQTLCQGFSGINATVNQVGNTINQGICTLGYNIQGGLNGISREIGDCCCKTQGAIADLKYSNERQTCDIINAINCSNQRIIDMYTADKIDTLNRKLAVAEGQISQYAQTNAIVSALKQPCPVPAYTVPNPNCCYNACGCSGNSFGGFSVQ